MASNSTSGDAPDASSAPFIIPGHENVSSYVTSVFKSVVGVSRTTNVLPAAGNDFDYYASFASFQEAMNLEGDRLLDLMTTIMKHQGAHNCRLGRQKTANDVEEKTDSVVDANDLILERVNNLLDEASGKKKTDPNLIVASLTEDAGGGLAATLSRLPPASKVATWNRATAGVGESKVDRTARSDGSGGDVRLLAAKNVARPQMSFKDTVDNGPVPFVCKLRVKPNAKTPLHLSFPSSDFVDNVGNEKGVHPYRDEIRSLVYPAHQMDPHPEPLVFPDSLEETPYTLVNTVAGLVNLKNELSKVDCFAVDLEAHSFRTFQGLTCLMQISTCSRDFVVDVLVPEVRQELQMLNESFTNPDIVKLFHGADWDIKWLQRDFGVYVVNMFDTYQASKSLDLARHSLAFLLHHYCDVEANKKYQMADWRIRPLPAELINYARTDTHYLLYIAAKMKNEILSLSNGRKVLSTVLSDSAQVTLSVFQKPAFDPEGYKSILFKHKKSFDSQQLAALASMYAWRDAIARQEDESVGFVVPNHMMIAIAEVMPREPNGILACCNPLPPLVKQQLNEIHRLIMDAKDVALVKPATTGPATKSVVQKTYAVDAKYDSKQLLQCPLDNSHRPDAPVGYEEEATAMEVDGVEDMAAKSWLLKTEVCEAVEKMTPVLPIGRDSAGSGGLSTAAKDPENGSSMFSGGTSSSAFVSPTASAADKAAAIHASFLSPFHIFLPPVLAPLPLGVDPPPKWKIKMIKKSSKLMEIQKAAERKKIDPSSAEEQLVKESKARAEKTEKKSVISLSALKEMEEEQAAKSGKKSAAGGAEKKTKKKKKKMVNLKKDDQLDASEIQEAKGKIFRESKKEKSVLGKRKSGDDDVVVVDDDEERDDVAGSEEGQTENASDPAAKKKRQEITPFDYSKVDMKVLSKGLNRKQAERAQVDPRSLLLKKKKSQKKALGKQHYGKDSFSGTKKSSPGRGGSSGGGMV